MSKSKKQLAKIYYQNREDKEIDALLRIYGDRINVIK
jgi:hypothetical protein